MTTPARRSRLLPIALIAVGAVWALLQFTPLTFGDVAFVLSAWPVVAIAAGLDLLTAGRARRVWIAAAAIGVVVWWLVGFLGPAAGGSVAVDHPIAAARAGSVALAFGVGSVRVTADAPSGTLLAGTLQLARGERVVQELDRSGAEVRLDVAVRGDGVVVRGRTGASSLALTGAIPIDLRVRAGVGDVAIDLAAARATALAFDAGVGGVDLTLPRAGGLTATVQLGVGSATLRVPSGVEARIAWQSGIGTLRYDDAFVRVGDVLTTAGYAAASPANRVDVALRGGIGGVRVERVP